MKCPEWLLEAMRKGEGVKCWVWDSSHMKLERIVVGFYGPKYRYPFITENEIGFEHAEPYTEPAHEFKLFEKVLVRNDDSEEWKAGLLSHNEGKNRFPIACAEMQFCECIPYAGNEHLLGATDNHKN